MQTVGGAAGVEQAVARLGGRIDRALPIINGYAVTIPADRLAELSATTGVTSVTPDSSMTPMSTTTTTTTVDTGSLSSISQIVGVQDMWNAGYAGQGIDIAVIDTGIARVPGLDGAGKVVDGPDLSLDPHDAATGGVDAFGHGTHMAGIIAGSDVAATTSTAGCSTCLGTSPYTDTTKFEGIAPAARLVNVKVGAYDGAADVSQVIAAIDWVVQHHADKGFNIRVINLSFGTDSAQSASVDPLAQAAEVAWRNGIVVVAAAGNEGRSTRTLADPAYNRAILAVGASDPKGTIATGDDSIPSFAQHGNARRGVDVVAPGVSVTSLRVPGSFVDQNTTTGRVGTRFQQGSGTSQATAVVSGLAAVFLSKYPSATPDTVKSYLKAWANPVTLLDPTDSRLGELAPKLVVAINNWYSGSGSASLAQGPSNLLLVPALPGLAVSDGSGTLEASRGTFHVVSNGETLQGESDIMGKPWSAPTMAASTAQGTTWSGGTWNGASWSGASWSGASWSSAAWTGNDWSGARWSGASWSASAWDGARWSGARWSGASWSSGTWDGARWSGARWSDAGWQ